MLSIHYDLQVSRGYLNALDLQGYHYVCCTELIGRIKLWEYTTAHATLHFAIHIPLMCSQQAVNHNAREISNSAFNICLECRVSGDQPQLLLFFLYEVLKVLINTSHCQVSRRCFWEFYMRLLWLMRIYGLTKTKYSKVNMLPLLIYILVFSQPF